MTCCSVIGNEIQIEMYDVILVRSQNFGRLAIHKLLPLNPCLQVTLRHLKQHIVDVSSLGLTYEDLSGTWLHELDALWLVTNPKDLRDDRYSAVIEDEVDAIVGRCNGGKTLGDGISWDSWCLNENHNNDQEFKPFLLGPVSCVESIFNHIIIGHRMFPLL